MFDVASASGGTQISLATSSDDIHPPENILDGADETYWATTGLFPQTVVIRFPALMSINKVELSSYNVKNVQFETSESDSGLDAFEPLAEREMDSTDHAVQQEDMNVGERKAQCLKMIIASGYDHFVAVYKVKVNGKALHG